jgi:hypothetical protein
VSQVISGRAPFSLTRRRLAHIRGQGQEGFRQQGQHERAPGFGLSDRDHSLAPMHVVEAQIDGCPTGVDHTVPTAEHREIPSSDGARPIGRGQDARDFLIRQHIAYPGLAVMTSGDRRR